MNKIREDCYVQHIIAGAHWQNKIKSLKGKIVMPFFLYIDDAEINNPLGGHTNAMSFVYYSFPLVHDSEIFLASVFKAKHYKRFGNASCLMHLVAEIISMEENGIEIQTSQGIKTVHFVLAMLLGDNLGLNTVLGFPGGFSANYFCRFCKEHRDETYTSFIEKTHLLRNKDNYEADVARQVFEKSVF